jgi:S1-C subfamily serine protease
MGRVNTVLRELSPSLIGASILEHFIVTLDSKSETAYFEQYRGSPFIRDSFGFSLALDEGISVSLVWEKSPAAEAGLHPGQRITAINGVPTESSCDGVRSALRAMSNDRIELEWEGGAATLSRSTPNLHQ